jgi:hypothetical protein
MADRKISDLTALTAPASGDYLPIVDISEAAAASKNKRITIEELMRGAPNGTAAAPSIAFESDPNTGIYSPGADQLAISTNGTGRLFVGSDGSVGVGGSNLATVPLLVQDTGNGVVIQNTASGNYAIGLLAGTGSQDAYVYQRASAPLIFGTSNTERMRLDSSGRLGLGTSSPATSTQIEVVKNSSTAWAANTIDDIYRAFNSNTATNAASSIIGAYCNYGDGTFAGVRFGAVSSASFSADFVVAPRNTGTFTEALRVTSLGRVGIGTTSPGVPLQVLNAGTGNNTNNGAISLCRTTTVGSTLYHMFSTAVSDEAFAFSVHGGTTFSDTTYTKYLASAGGIHIWYGATNATERARIDSSGRLLVGTSSDSGGALLQVNGNRIRIATANTPASAGATGTTGEIAWDADYIYVCTATNTWKRTAIATW